MPTKLPQLVNGEIYYLVSMGVEKRDIFLNDKDRYRFIHDIFEFNDENLAPSAWRNSQNRSNVSGSDPDTLMENLRKPRNPLVEILCFCLMTNHFHLVVRQLKEKGISEFIKKLKGGYATYFNKKHDRVGHLFQGRFKAIHIKDDDQFKNVFVYVSVNPMDMLEPNWKENGIKNAEKAVKFLEKYKWSSYADYIGGKNFPSITNRDFVMELLGGVDGCCQFVENWILYKAEIANLGDVILE